MLEIFLSDGEDTVQQLIFRLRLLPVILHRLLLWIPKDFMEVEVTLISTGIIAYPLKHVYFIKAFTYLLLFAYYDQHHDAPHVMFWEM